MPDHRAFVRALVGALITRDVGSGTDEEREATARFVLARLGAAPSLTRLAFVVLATLLATVVLVAERRPLERLSEERRQRWVARLGSTPVPGVADYVDAVRALVLTYVYERRGS